MVNASTKGTSEYEAIFFSEGEVIFFHKTTAIAVLAMRAMASWMESWLISSGRNLISRSPQRKKNPNSSGITPARAALLDRILNRAASGGKLAMIRALEKKLDCSQVISPPKKIINPVLI